MGVYRQAARALAVDARHILVIVVGRDSKTDSLFDPTIATFEDDAGAYDQKDAAGFIKLNALRMRIAANLRAKKGLA